MKMTQDAQETGNDSYAAIRSPSAVSYFACPQEFSNWDRETVISVLLLCLATIC